MTSMGENRGKRGREDPAASWSHSGDRDQAVGLPVSQAGMREIREVREDQSDLHVRQGTGWELRPGIQSQN